MPVQLGSPLTPVTSLTWVPFQGRCPESKVVRGRFVVNLDLDRLGAEVDVLCAAPERIGRIAQPRRIVVALPVQGRRLARAGRLTTRCARREREQNGAGQRSKDEVGDAFHGRLPCTPGYLDPSSEFY